MTDGQAITRVWSDLSDDEHDVIKLLYVQGVYSLAQIARVWQLNYNGLKHVAYRNKWPEEKDATAVSIDQNILAHTKFMRRVFHMMGNIQRGWEELLARHQLYDSFTDFPFVSYFEFLETYAKVVTSLGGVKAMSNDMHLHLQQTNNVQNNNVRLGAEGEEVVPIQDREAKVLVTKLIESMVLKQRPPQPREISAQTVKDNNEPDPAQGKFR